MSQLIRDFKSRMSVLGWKDTDLADKIHKDPSTIKKQLDPKTSNPQLSNLEMMAEALGGSIAFITPETEKALNDADVTAWRNRVSELTSEVDRLRERVASLETLLAEKIAKIQKRDEIIAKRDETISHKDEIIEEKDRTIARKDAKLSEFVDRLFLRLENIGK